MMRRAAASVRLRLAHDAPGSPGPTRPLRAVVAAFAVSSYGNFLNLIAMSLFIYEVTGSGLGMGLLMALRLFCGFLAGLVAGGLAARIGRRRMMIGADLAQAAAMAVLVLCARSASVGVLAVVVSVLGAGNTVFNVALRSAVPAIVGPEARAHANGQLVSARSVATVAGFASAAPVIGIAGYGGAFALNGISFLVSAAVMSLLRVRTEESEPGTKAAGEPEPVSLRHVVTAVPALLAGMVLLRGVDALASSSHNVALPVLAALRSPENPAVFMTEFWASWAVGTLVAHHVLKRRRASVSEQRRDTLTFILGTCAMSLFFVLAFTASAPVPLMAIAALAGAADGATEIVYTSRLQAAPDRERTRLFGLSATVETCGFTLGMVSASAALEVWPPLLVVGAFHGLALCGAMSLLAASAAGRRGTPRQRA